jgi:hypothetical protein
MVAVHAEISKVASVPAACPGVADGVVIGAPDERWARPSTPWSRRRQARGRLSQTSSCSAVPCWPYYQCPISRPTSSRTCCVAAAAGSGGLRRCVDCLWNRYARIGMAAAPFRCSGRGRPCAPGRLGIDESGIGR